MKKKISFVIPCYNSAETIPGVAARIAVLYGAHAAYDYEIVLVNDCSPDRKTFEAIQKICAENSRVKGIDLSKNFGQHSAVMAGLHNIDGDIVVCMDDDGQTPPEEVCKLIEQVEQGHDVSIARYAHKQHSLFRNVGSKANEQMAKWLIGKPGNLTLGSFFAMKRYIAEEMCTYTFPYPYTSGLLLRATGDIVNVDVRHEERKTGQSGYTFGKLISLWFNGFTNFSIKPLRIASFLGVLIAILGFALGIYAIVVKITTPEAPLGWASMTAAVAFIGGLILLVLGLVGEYVGRMFMGLNQHPQYVIREMLNVKKDDE